MSTLTFARFDGLDREAPLRIAILTFPDVDTMDVIGPFSVFCRLPKTTIALVAKERGPITDGFGLRLSPDVGFAEAEHADVLVLPGGGGVDALYDDDATLAFVRRMATSARLVMSVCTGALVAGAAGLLRGRHVTSHWASHHLLALVDAVAVDARVVVDAPFVSTAGISAGLDGALEVAALLRGRRVADEVQLQLEYDPDPPNRSGSPAHAGPELTRAVRDHFRPRIERRESRLRAWRDARSRA